MAKFAILILSSVIASAQVPSGQVLGTGYRQTRNPVKVAPWQVVMFNVLGLRITSALPPTNVDENGRFRPEIDGVRAVIRAHSREWHAGIVGLRQAPCAQTPSGCEPVTSVTVQMPQDLPPVVTDEPSAPTLHITKNGVELASARLQVEPDNLHILTSCDETSLWISLFYDVSRNTCAVAVTHGNGRRVTAEDPAIPGETLVLWVLGAGAPDSPRTFPYVPQVAHDYRINGSMRQSAFANGPVQAVSSAVPIGFVGLTQINFVLQPPPPGTVVQACNGTSVRTNLTLSIIGQASLDSASICVRP